VIALTKQLGQIICECDPARAAERDRVMLAEMAEGRGEIVRQDMLPALLPGSLVKAGERFGRGAGTTFPQPMIHHGSGLARMDDIAGCGFQLFVNASHGALPDITGIDVLHVDTAQGAGVLQETDGIVAQWFASHGVCAALVRPDRVVFGTAASADDAPELAAALLQAMGVAECSDGPLQTAGQD
jgi:3-(3-hydroxy-phenyl)propionate hydroxylase